MSIAARKKTTAKRPLLIGVKLGELATEDKQDVDVRHRAARKRGDGITAADQLTLLATKVVGLSTLG